MTLTASSVLVVDDDVDVLSTVFCTHDTMMMMMLILMSEEQQMM